MHINILTIFPQMFETPFGFGIFKRAIDDGLISINPINIREYTHDKHHTTDDYPYGGGAGMVMKPEPIFEAVESIKTNLEDKGSEMPVILLTPQGRLFTHKIAQELAEYPCIVLICGHYEGVDERVVENLATDTISIGDYVLTGGELPAMVVADAGAGAFIAKNNPTSQLPTIRTFLTFCKAMKKPLSRNRMHCSLLDTRWARQVPCN